MTAEAKMRSEEVHGCARCGACLTACPVYAELRNETASPRAKVQLIRHYAEKGLPPSRHLNELVARCLMCGACTANCPSGVPHDRLFMRMRAHLCPDYGEDWRLKVLFHLLTHDQQLALAARFARFGRKAVLERVVREATLGSIPLKRLPAFNGRPFRDQVPAVSLPAGEPRGTVLYFTGCATQHLFDGVGHAVVRVLTRMGFRVEIPRGQVCCGLPLFAHGKLTAARNSIETNIALLDRKGIAAVVTDCATCGSALRREYAAVLDELGLPAAAARRLASRVRDVSEFILENDALLEPALDPGAHRETVTYHAPCHLRNAQGVKTGVADLLDRLPHAAYVPASDADACCGGGGTFFYDYPEISRRMAARKIENARATGARYWVTGCPGCRVNLAGNLSDTDGITVLHPVELVARGLVS